MRVKLDFPLTVNEICKATDAIKGENIDNRKYISHISTDTRDCLIDDLFIALNGENDSGEKYVNEAICKGALVISSKSSPYVIKVNDTKEALLSVARYYKSKTKIKYTVAVTGSVGKTTTVRFISKILSKRYKVHSPIGNYNNDIGVPLTVLSVDRNADILVVELGMNHKNEISRLAKCVSPDIGIITSIGSSHIGNLGSREAIAEAKLEIRDGMDRGLLLLPYDEPLLKEIKDALYVAISSPLSNFSLEKTRYDSLLFSSPYGRIEITSPPKLHRHLMNDLAFAISVSQLLNLSEEEIKRGVEAITSFDLRQRFIELSNFTIFDDSYNASLESVKADLEYISSYKRPKGAFLGDILELGDKSDIIHREIGYAAAEFKIDRLYLYGKYALSTAQGAKDAGMDKNSIFINCDISSPRTSISHIKDHHAHNEIILFKASHKLRLDKIADTIAKEERFDK